MQLASGGQDPMPALRLLPAASFSGRLPNLAHGRTLAFPCFPIHIAMLKATSVVAQVAMQQGAYGHHQRRTKSCCQAQIDPETLSPWFHLRLHYFKIDADILASCLDPIAKQTRRSGVSGRWRTRTRRSNAYPGGSKGSHKRFPFRALQLS